ncbi:uncharacterized protein LOC106171323 isoform X1 [Lingula anatina]|uniref:Uncharacterized protein LOC106171323 isoform X1 n=1 Tax=Lingula anatina TaxID=7574 RepID=A0A1S3JB17_LINAN|nr:uncharacterized protein LOC106171323 isoform X1 [Lingula anatina]|eukprot:XP_013407074.1 uncharacterized protein LOC106171323 isoform X1 [Lingula anatina]
MRTYYHIQTAVVFLWILYKESSGQGSANKTKVNCGPGDYINRDANACRPCGIATFNPFPNAEVCFPCPEGQTTEVIGAKYHGDCIGPCEKVQFPCQLTATYGVPGQCNKYFQCSHGGGLLSVQMCPSGTFFNPFRKVCDIYLNMECTPNNCPDDFVSRLEAYSEEPSTTTISTTTKAFVTHKQTKPCGDVSLPCTIGTTWPSPGRCDKYIECAGGMEFLERPCPIGTMYSDFHKSCGRDIQCIPRDCNGNEIGPTYPTFPVRPTTKTKKPTQLTSPEVKTTDTESPSPTTSTTTTTTTTVTTTTTPTTTTTLPIFPNITSDPGIVVTYKGEGNKSSEQEDGSQSYKMLVILAILILVVLIVAVVGGLCMWKRRAIKRSSGPETESWSFNCPLHVPKCTWEIPFTFQCPLRRKRRAQRHVDNPEYVWKTEDAYAEINEQHVGRTLPKKPNIPLPEVPNEDPIYNSIPDVVHEHRPKNATWGEEDPGPKHHHHESRKAHETLAVSPQNNSASHHSPKQHSPKHHKPRHGGHAGQGGRTKHGHGRRARENSTKELISPGAKDSNTYSHAWD